jgi:hypothetical protein
VSVRRGERAARLFDDRSGYVDRFGLLLTLTSLAVVLLSLVDLDTGDPDAAGWLALAATAWVALTVSVALRASGLARRRQRILDAVLMLGLVALLVVTLFSVADEAFAPPAATTLLSALAPAVVVRRLVRHRRVARSTLLGAISAYLLVAVAFFFAFLTVNRYQAEPFFGQQEATTSFMYFSLTTITTLGYGDLSAAADFGRLLATTEAVIGQVYLVTVVAMIVGLLGQRWGPRASEDDPEATDADG